MGRVKNILRTTIASDSESVIRPRALYTMRFRVNVETEAPSVPDRYAFTLQFCTCLSNFQKSDVRLFSR